MEYKYYKDFLPSVRELWKSGGQHQRAAATVQAVIGRISTGEPDPFVGIPLTNHGESRIDKCVKYDLNGFCRLITVTDDGICCLLFAGSHKRCDRWIENQRGFVPARDARGELVDARRSSVALDPDTRISGESGHSYGKLYEALGDEQFDQLVDGLSRGIVRRLEGLESIHSEQDIERVVVQIVDANHRAAVYDVFSLLRQNNVRAAIRRVGIHVGHLTPLPEVDPSERGELIDSDTLKRIPADSPQFVHLFEHYVQTADYRDWMLFTHPDQERVAEARFAGPAKLTGVSGSGKTAIVVKRTLILAERYPEGQILILTLNRPLAKLIEDLVQNCGLPGTRARISALPFFGLCQRLLHEFEPDHDRLYDDVTWRSNEHIDEVWQEYYRCELNNRGASVLQPLHDSLISRTIDAEDYIREEFDWIRSAVPSTDRKRYLSMSRTGRSYPLDDRFRKDLLEGLDRWERKMVHVGVTDYLGVATVLYRHKDKLHPRYRCMLVDECQDFGTMELELIRALVPSGEDDLFLCGDAAQHVSWKHQSFRDAGIDVPGARSIALRQNYRNSRDVLRAAHELLRRNMTEEMREREDFEILDPEFANFGGPAPLCLKAAHLEQELGAALAFIKDDMQGRPGRKGCLAICGYSLHEIRAFGQRIGFPVLDGTCSLENGDTFLSDLEQTKGFEFDIVCIVNVKQGVIPDPATPERERFRDLCRLYVATTRAKTQLILSYSDERSPFLGESLGDSQYLLDGEWSEFVGLDKIERTGTPPRLEELRQQNITLPRLGDMTGEQFLYTEHALGLSPELIAKLRELVSGISRIEDRNPIEWPRLAAAVSDYRNPRFRQRFGPQVGQEFDALMRKLGL